MIGDGSAMDALVAVGLALALVHFTVPLAYFSIARRWLSAPWSPRVDPGYRLRVTVIVPTYNEASFIERKLDNIYHQSYPRDLVEVIVVDGASSDGTADLAERWARSHGDLRVRVVREPVRGGKAPALNKALKEASGDVIVISDADALWDRDSLAEAIKILSDPSVGAVSCVKTPINGGSVENTYRGYYNEIRVGESIYSSTPIFHGELAAFKREALELVGGFPEDLGADDSHTATLIALKGYRAVITPSVKCYEAVPREGYIAWRIRRAQHLIQHFAKTLKKIRRAPKKLKKILLIEAYLHLANPPILAIATALMITASLMRSIEAAIPLAIGIALLAYKPYRTWLTTQAILLIAIIKNTWSKETVWRKHAKT